MSGFECTVTAYLLFQPSVLRGGADRLRVGGYGGRDNEASALCRPIQGIVTGSYRLTG